MTKSPAFSAGGVARRKRAIFVYRMGQVCGQDKVTREPARRIGLHEALGGRWVLAPRQLEFMGVMCTER
jgi:hypothetical protein